MSRGGPVNWWVYEFVCKFCGIAESRDHSGAVFFIHQMKESSVVFS